MYFLKTKECHEVLKCFRFFKAQVENETGKRIKQFRSDNGLEFVGKDLGDKLMEWGIKHETTIQYNPEQNWVAEWANRTIVEKARSMLYGANLPKCYWVQACQTAVYLKNRTPTRILGNGIPEEKWSGIRVNLSHLKVFGCMAYAYVPKELRKKMDPKSKKHYFVGYREESKGYWLADPSNGGKIVKSRDVVFF